MDPWTCSIIITIIIMGMIHIIDLRWSSKCRKALARGLFLSLSKNFYCLRYGLCSVDNTSSDTVQFTEVQIMISILVNSTQNNPPTVKREQQSDESHYLIPQCNALQCSVVRGNWSRRQRPTERYWPQHIVGGERTITHKSKHWLRLWNWKGKSQVGRSAILISTT